MRRAALRFLTIQPASFAIRSRTITSFSSPLRIQKQTTALFPQRRWASDDSAKAEEAPISKIQPTPQEEVENAVHEDNAVLSDAEPTDSAADVQGSAQLESTNDDFVDDVKPAFDRSRENPDENAPKPNVYIGNLFFDVTEEDLTKELSRFGKIRNVKIIRDNQGLSKGCVHESLLHPSLFLRAKYLESSCN